MIINSESTKIFLGSIAVILGSCLSVLVVGTLLIGLSPATSNQVITIDLAIAVGYYARFTHGAVSRKLTWFVAMAFFISFIAGLACAIAARFVNPTV